MGPLATIDFTSVNIVAKSCSLNTPTIGVSLGRNSLNKFTGIGSTTNNVPFSIGLSCSSGARINVALEVMADSSQPGTIQLTPGSATAMGIGVQLLDAQSNPLPLNISFLAGTAASEGLYNLNWNARYIQTSSKVISGTANATATFTLTYL